MKTVFKKMLSLVLVAMLLVSAVPFQASAEAVRMYRYTVTADGNEYSCTSSTGSVTEAEFYSALGIGKGEDAGLDAAVAAKVTFPVDVTSGTVVIALGNTLGGNDNDDTNDNITPVTPPANQPDTEENEGTPEVGGEAMPDDVAIACKLTIDYNLSGYTVNTVNATIGATYSNYVGVPARGGYDFLGWYSADYGRIVDITKDILRGDDTISGMWSGAKKFSLTLDENRKGEEYVNRIKQVTYGAAIGDLYTPTREGYTFVGWKLNGKYITKDTIWDYQGDATAYAEWRLADDAGNAMGGTSSEYKGDVYLEIYKNGNTNELVKRVKINSYVEDNKVTLADAKAIAKKYVTAKSGYSLEFDGLFDEEGWWWYCRDEETDGEKSVIVNRDGDDYVYIMVKNVKSSSNADSSNPKTGDTIYMAVTVMALSASALAAAYYFSKKRAI